MSTDQNEKACPICKTGNKPRLIEGVMIHETDGRRLLYVCSGNAGDYHAAVSAPAAPQPGARAWPTKEELDNRIMEILSVSIPAPGLEFQQFLKGALEHLASWLESYHA